MASKFAPIAKLKKEKLERLRREMALINQQIRTIESEMQAAKTELLSCKMPQGGSIKLFAQYTFTTQSYKHQMEQAKEALFQAMKQKNRIQSHLNEALIEFEKFKYLQTQEEMAWAQKLRKQEGVLMDEIAVMGYNLNQGTAV